MKNVFITCVKKKADKKCAARDLYISALFKKNLAYAESLKPDNIYILSAKHHLVELDDILEPYNETLLDYSADQKKEWAEEVIKQMEKKGIKSSDDNIFLAGKVYTKYLKEYFPKAKYPFESLLGIGYILEWLTDKLEQKGKYNLQDMKIKEQLLKLAKMLIKFATIEVGETTWTYEGDFVEGTEVYVEDEQGDMMPVADGEYQKDDTIITIKDGKIESIVEKEIEDPEPEPDPENLEDERVVELKTRITELEGLLQDRDAIVEQLTKENEDLKAEIETLKNQPKEEPVEMKKTPKEGFSKEIENKALRYFKN